MSRNDPVSRISEWRAPAALRSQPISPSLRPRPMRWARAAAEVAGWLAAIALVSWALQEVPW